MERCVFGILAFAIAVGCGAAPERAALLSHSMSRIIGGALDAGDPAVVMVFGQDQYAAGFCTGTVIAPRAVITAAHCTVQATPCPGAGCLPRDPSYYTIIGGNDPFNVGVEWTRAVIAVYPNPAFELDDSTIAHDDAILILDADAPVTPLGWQKERADAPYVTGTDFIQVGYGMDSVDENTAKEGVKKVASFAITGQSPSTFFYGTASESVYLGDSGGPAIVGGVVIGTSTYLYQDQNGVYVDADVRTDDNADFIASAIASVPTATPAPGATPGDGAAGGGSLDGGMSAGGCAIASGALDGSASGAACALGVSCVLALLGCARRLGRARASAGDLG